MTTRSSADRQSMPLRLRDQLVSSFRAEGLQAGDRLPSETEIAERFEVGRSTAREALKLLEQEGYVSVRAGRGRYMSSLAAIEVERPITRFESMTTMLVALGYQTQTMVLAATEGDASDAERDELGLEADRRVIRLERLRCTLDGEPLIYSLDVIPRDVVPGPLKHMNWSGSLNDLLSAQGHSPVSSAARLRAVELPGSVAAKYSLADLGPWLLISESVITASGRRVLYAQGYHRGEKFAFNVVRR
jgi:GntR family transcriptional regulator